jgi:stage II sporulation protein D
MEALKAQAILARTFVLKFVEEKHPSTRARTSRPISPKPRPMTRLINDRIIKAVDETRGQVLSYNGEFPYAWFHAHAGGRRTWPPRRSTMKGRAGLHRVGAVARSDRAPDAVKNWNPRSRRRGGRGRGKAGVKTGTVRTIETAKRARPAGR